VRLLQPSKLTVNDVFEHPYLLLAIVAIGLSFVIYVLYMYYASNSQLNIKPNYTYFGKNPISDAPLYSVETPDATTCRTRCIEDPACDGITYDSLNSLCIGSKNGVLREDDTNYSAWVKPVVAIDVYLSKTIIVSFTDMEYTVKNSAITQPYVVGQFTYATWLNISEWYDNFEYWKHIAHKGTAPAGSYNYRIWSDVIADVPDQCIGLWLAPFTNNLRIAITTEITETAPFEEHAGTTATANRIMVEHADVQNIPINTLYHLAVAFNGSLMEIYTNGGLYKVVELRGLPRTNGGDMYVKHEKTFNGGIYQMCYTPMLTKIADIAQFASSKPKVST
jgi:hypothetical protein